MRSLKRLHVRPYRIGQETIDAIWGGSLALIVVAGVLALVNFLIVPFLLSLRGS